MDRGEKEKRIPLRGAHAIIWTKKKTGAGCESDWAGNEAQWPMVEVSGPSLNPNICLLYEPEAPYSSSLTTRMCPHWSIQLFFHANPAGWQTVRITDKDIYVSSRKNAADKILLNCDINLAGY